MKKYIRIGVDLGKGYFQVHALENEAGVAVNRKISRGKFLAFFSGISPCRVGMEACGSSNYWAREIAGLGHEPWRWPTSWPEYAGRSCRPANASARRHTRKPSQGAVKNKEARRRAVSFSKVWQARRSVMNDNDSKRKPGHPVTRHEHQARRNDRDHGRRTSSGPADICAATTGRTYDRELPMSSKTKITLARKGRPHMTGRPALRARACLFLARRLRETRRAAGPAMNRPRPP
jgi:hypothetical protein